MRTDTLGAELLLARQNAATQRAADAAITLRLARWGSSRGRAYAAHRAALAGYPHDQADAAAWRHAVIEAAELLSR